MIHFYIGPISILDIAFRHHEIFRDIINIDIHTDEKSSENWHEMLA